MATNDLFNYMRDATQQMQSEYERIQKRASEDPGTAGDNGEENWAELLRRWLPKNYHVVTKGRIMNMKGDCSPQVDVLILSPSYPEALLDRKEYLEGGVLAAFECKLTLRANHIPTAVKNAAKIRRLSDSQRKGTPFQELNSRVRYGLLAHSHIWRGSNSSAIEKIESYTRTAEKIIVKHPREEIDSICVSNLATWNAGKMLIFGAHMLSQLEIRYQYMGKKWDALRGEGGLIETFHTCFAEIHESDEEKKKLFTPIGSFLTNLLSMLAWNDPSLRPIADYFLGAAVMGSGMGYGKICSTTVLSDELLGKLRSGHSMQSGDRWNEWQMMF